MMDKANPENVVKELTMLLMYSTRKPSVQVSCNY